jgi:hypothetical protein
VFDDACVRSYILVGAGRVPLGHGTTGVGHEYGGGATLSYMAFAAAAQYSLVHGFVFLFQYWIPKFK